MLGFHIQQFYRCYKCNILVDNKNRITNHLWKAHENFQLEEEFLATLYDSNAFSIYHCCFCKYSSHKRTYVENHLDGEHYDEFEKDFNSERITSSSDSLDELLSPENHVTLMNELKNLSNNHSNPKRRPHNDLSFHYRCVRCKKNFSRKHWLKEHICIRANTKMIEEEEKIISAPKKSKITNNLVNGFYHCQHEKCSQVYTDKKLFDEHVNNHAS